MTDVKKDLQLLNRVEMPVRWSDVADRTPRRTLPQPSRWQRAGVGVLAFGVFAAAAVFAWMALGPLDDSPRSGPVVLGDVLVWVPTPDFVDFDIYVMNTDGSGLRPVLADPAYRDSDAVLSPDGTKIAFVRSKAPVPDDEFGNVIQGGSDIYVMDADGTNLEQLTSQPEGRASHDEPAWSPDGTKIAYRSNEAGGPDIWVMDADGSNQHTLTRIGSNGEPIWSPDGSKMAFGSDRLRPDDAWGLNIWVMNADGSNPVRLTNTDVGDIVTSWSPDGSKIAFHRSAFHSDYAWDIWTMNADGTGQRQVTDWPGMDVQALWSPDGTRLMFQSDRYIDEQMALDEVGEDESASPSWPMAVYVMDADGSNVTQIIAPERDAVPSHWTSRS